MRCNHVCTHRVEIRKKQCNMCANQSPQWDHLDVFDQERFSETTQTRLLGANGWQALQKLNPTSPPQSPTHDLTGNADNETLRWTDFNVQIRSEHEIMIELNESVFSRYRFCSAIFSAQYFILYITPYFLQRIYATHLHHWRHTFHSLLQRWLPWALHCCSYSVL